MKPEITELKARVARHPFLAGMTPEQVELMAASASLVQFDRGQVLFRAGQEAHGFYLIENGRVDLEGTLDEKPHIRIDTVSAGEPLGWSWLFPPHLWSFDARATEPTTAVFFDRTTLRKACDEDLTLGHELFKRMSNVMVRRLQASRARIIELHHKMN